MSEQKTNDFMTAQISQHIKKEQSTKDMMAQMKALTVHMERALQAVEECHETGGDMSDEEILHVVNSLRLATESTKEEASKIIHSEIEGKLESSKG